MQNEKWKMQTESNPTQNVKSMLIALSILSAIVLLAACGGESPTQIPPTSLPPTDAPTATRVRATSTRAAQASNVCAPGNAPAYITQVVLAKGSQGENFTPVDITDEFAPNQATFHAIVTLENAPANLTLGSKWYLVQATGYTPNSLIDDNEIPVDQGGSRNVDFTLKTSQDTWPAGTYCVEIYAEGNLALSKSFSVIGDTTPSNATASIVKQIVLAQDTKPETFEPVNPTTVFKTNAQAIHAAVQIENAPANTLFQAKWYPPNQEPLEFNLPPVDGSRWIDFRLTPAPDGFPTGEYQVEIYLNGELVDTKTFTVE